MEKKIRELFPEIEWIKDPELQAKVVASYVDALKTGGWEPEDMDKIPFTLLIPNCPFSYLEHVRGVTRVAKRAMDEFNAIYSAKDAKFTIDNDLLVAGALLHDVGKLVEYDATGNEIRPLDISITKVTLALLINSALLLLIILSVAHWYRKHPQGSAAPGGFIGFMEMFIMMVNDDIIKSCVGPKYRKFAPYLLTAFFFIFINNIMGLIPFFPGGANVTGNIAITMVLAICTFLAVNIFGTKTYWKDIFWPDVPWWLKVPVPMMPFIEFFGIFTKPFALMIRLFANMLAGHMAMLVLTCLIFISASMGPALNGTLTVASVLFNIFMNALELLVAFIQAYVFTMLSAVFIGLAQEEHKEKAVK